MNEVGKEAHEKPINKKSNHKNWILSGALITALVWGSCFLVASIAHLREVALQQKQQEFLEDVRLTRYDYEDVYEYEGKHIGLKEIRNSSFSPEYRSIQWISEPSSFENDKGTFTTHENDVYLIKSIENESYSKLLHNGSTIEYQGASYTIDSFVSSPDLKLALIQTNSTQHWRHSTFGRYWILDVDTNEIKPLTDNRLSIAKWSPTSADIAYVYENNVFIYNLQSEESVQSSFNGGENVFNGKPDWVYEEEVLEGDTALWWSPNGKHVAYLSLNDTLVPKYLIPYFVQEQNNSYPKLLELKYPKAGFENPRVKVVLHDLDAGSSKQVDYESDIINEVVWVGDEQLLIKTTNRESDFLKVVLIDAKDVSFKIVRDEVADSWFEITHNTLYIPASDSRLEPGYIDTISVDGFNHLAYYSPPSNSTPTILTRGQWEVDGGPSSFDFKKNLVYFISTKDSSIERHLYSVNLISGEILKHTNGEGWFSVSFSSGARYVSQTYVGPDIPYQKLIDLHIGQEKQLEDNQNLKDLLSEYDLSKISYGEVDIGTAVVNYVERLPPKFDPSKKYPILFFVYGGPNSQLVTKRYSLSFSDVVSSQLNAVVVTVDGRGTGFKGRKFRSVVRDKLGYYETIDQIAAAKFWGSKSYIDEKRIAIFGWSYGGYMTLKTLERDAGQTFSYGMSVAPVTDWRYYDSIYTERYMHTPQNNPEGYKNSAVTNITAIGQAKRFLLMHGTGDDNVHIQNSLQFLDHADLAGIENYDVHIFPDSDHAIRYHNADVIVYDKLLLWLRKAFRGDYLKYY